MGDELELRHYTGPQDLVVQGRYNIPEPTGALFTDFAAIELAVIPGMAFDRCHHRLGRGKGYYDRFLSQPALAGVRKVGLCFDFQLLPTIPHEPHDQMVDDLLILPLSH